LSSKKELFWKITVFKVFLLVFLKNNLNGSLIKKINKSYKKTNSKNFYWKKILNI